MQRYFFILLLFTLSCNQAPQTVTAPWTPYDETAELAANADHPSQKMQFKLIQSKVNDKNDAWKAIVPQISDFSDEDYVRLKPLILEQDIPTVQSHIASGALTYTALTQWYLYRILKFEYDRNTYLNAIISINPDAVDEAKQKDEARSDNDHPIYGMPILLKDNINTEGMLTTAGAHAFRNNQTSNAFIVDRIQEKGAIILGKTSLSEWANYLCLGCPNGYSAVGGQTLNPYGRKRFDTGGSSSGSGVAMAVNYAAAAVGTETSGSILSPSSKSSLVGLKPTVGLLSRGGIVPISSTLDTPGPMTRNTIDNAILLDAISSEDPADPATKDNPKNKRYWQDITSGSLEGMRFGVIKDFLEDSVYQKTIETIAALGGITIEFEPLQLDFGTFSALLSADMRIDLPAYIENYASDIITFRSVEDIVAYNKQDSTVRIPYGQARFAGILDVNLTPEELAEIKTTLHARGVRFFETPMQEHQLDAVLSMNNRNARYAAAARYPCLTVPMGYQASGEASGLTFIARPFEEDKLLQMGYAFEQATRLRTMPAGYE